MKFFIIIAALFALVCMLMLFWWFQGSYYFDTGSSRPYRIPPGEIHGVDVSHYSGPVDFERIKAQRFAFVFLRSTMGVNGVDYRFHQHRKAAEWAGLKWGCYHFFRFGEDGAAQARHLLRTLDGHRPDLPLVIDVEEEGPNRNCGKSTASVRLEVKRCIKHLKKAGYAHVMLYSNESGYRKYLQGHTDEHHLWIASLKRRPALTRTWTFQQYRLDAPLYGVTGRADYNRFHGDAEEWQRFLNKVKMK